MGGPRTPRKRVIFQCKKAAAYMERVLDHLMAADVIAKGGTIDGHGKLLPKGVDVNNPDKDGHPVLNEYMPTLVQLITATQDAIKRMVKKL